ncbi:MAG: DUF6804 family protein [Saprospiraceae bacterium]
MKNNRWENVIRIGLAILLFLCLLDMPYGYFQLVRTISTIVFIYFGIDAKRKGDETNMFIYFGLALLFQPIFKIALGRTLWNVVDVIVGIWLLLGRRK